MTRPWIIAIRPHTLPAGAVPVLVGTAVAFDAGGFALGPAVAALACALLLQVGVNLVNDADDFERGADTAERVGFTRVSQSGLIPPVTLRRAASAAFAGASGAGLYLCAHAGWHLLPLGAAAIASALAYTGGPWPLGYNGLGDLFVFLFFGLMAVAGTTYVQLSTTTPVSWAVAVAVGTLATAILAVNNVRDVDTDRQAGKRTLPVRFGTRFGRVEYAALLLTSYAVPPLLVFAGSAEVEVMIPWLSLPHAIGLAQRMLAGESGSSLNDLLASTARLQLAFGILLSIGLVLP